MTYRDDINPETSPEAPDYSIAPSEPNDSTTPEQIRLADAALSQIAGYIEDFDITDRIGFFAPNASAYRTILRQIAEFADTDPEDGYLNPRERVDQYLKVGFHETFDERIAENELKRANNVVGEITRIKYLVNRNRARLGFMKGDNRVQPASKYGLLKTIGLFDVEESPSDRGTLWMLALNRIEKNEDDKFVREVYSELEAGEFDDYVASDLIRESEDPEISSAKAKELEPVTRFLKFLNDVFPDDANERDLNLRLFSNEVMRSWPKEVLSLVEKRRKEMLATSEEKIDGYARNLRAKGLVSLPKDEKNLIGNVNAYFRDLKKLMNTQNSIASVLKRKRMPVVEPSEELPVFETASEEEPQHNLVKAYSPEGEILEIDEDRMVAIAEEDGLDIRDKNFESDLRNIFNYLISINKAQSADAGLKKLGREFQGKDNGRDLWEFKPSEATGLPTSTKLTKNIRVIISMCDEGFIVHGLVRRDGLDKGLRSIVDGLRTHQ